MADVGFGDLVELYRHTAFDGGGGVLRVVNNHVANTLREIDADEALYDLTQISLVDARAFSVGDSVAINVRAPSYKLGLLARDFDAVFAAPHASFEEPGAYYVIDPGYARGDVPVPVALARYRAMLTVVSLLREAANYVSEHQRELVFIGEEQVVVPISFVASDLPASIEEHPHRGSSGRRCPL